MGEWEELEFGALLWTEKPASNRSLMRPRLVGRAILKLILKQECGHLWT